MHHHHCGQQGEYAVFCLFVCLFIYFLGVQTCIHTFLCTIHPFQTQKVVDERYIHGLNIYIYIYIYIDRYMYEIGCAVYSMKMKKKNHLVRLFLDANSAYVQFVRFLLLSYSILFFFFCVCDITTIGKIQ
jgi:hypothetical protein